LFGCVWGTFELVKRILRRGFKEIKKKRDNIVGKVRGENTQFKSH